MGGGAGLAHYRPQPRFGDSGESSATSTSARAGSGAAAAALGEGLNRVMTGDHCTTLLWEDDHLDVSMWHEQDGVTTVLPSQTALFSITAEGAAALSAGCEGELPAGVQLGGKLEGGSIVNPLSAVLHGERSGMFEVCGKKVDSASLLAHVVVKCLESTHPQKEEESQTTRKSKKKKRSASAPSMTLVLPCSFTFDQSTRAAVAVQKTGCTLKNIFNRGVAAVAYNIVVNRSVMNLDEGSAPEGDNDLYVLYVHACTGSNSREAPTHFEAALVRCELLSAALSAKLKRPKGRDVTRIWCPSQTSGPDLATAVGSLPPLPAGAELWACIASTRDDASLAAIRDLGLVKKATLFVRVGANDSVQGGCLLSAAELDSSKQYVQLEDGSHSTVYHLPVADGLLVNDVGWRVRESEDDKKTKLVEPEVVFTVGTRIAKKDLGVIRPSMLKLTAPIGKKVFDNKSKDEDGVWPRLELLSRASPTAAWTPFTTFSPLRGSGEAGGVENCTVVLKLHQGTGHVRYELLQGKSLREMRLRKWWWIRAVLIVVAIAAAAMGVKMGLAWKVRRDFQAKVDWLADFYREHAPEKLQNMTQVERTVNRFQGKLWALQIELEKKYDAKMKKPNPEAETEL